MKYFYLFIYAYKHINVVNKYWDINIKHIKWESEAKKNLN